MISVDGMVWTASDDNRIRIWTKFAVFHHEIQLPRDFAHLSSIVDTGTEVWCGSLDKLIVAVDYVSFIL